MKPRHWRLAALSLASALVLAPTLGAAQDRALNDPVVAHPDPESLFTSSDPKLHRNKQAALHIQRDLLQCGHWNRAGEWLTEAYIQHNPVASSGRANVVNFFTKVLGLKPVTPCPALSAADPSGVVMVIAEGDYVTIMTRRVVPYADRPGESYTTTWFDTWRFVDGKADEHWDGATLEPQPTAG
jgi:predicted SnoaL-like aldol condensation-catalyzing enzyme